MIYGDFMMIYDDFMMIYDDLWWFYDDFMMIYDDLWWFMMIYDDLWWFMMIYDDLWWHNGDLWWFYGISCKYENVMIPAAVMLLLILGKWQPDVICLGWVFQSTTRDGYVARVRGTATELRITWAVFKTPLVGGLEHVLFFRILGISSSQLKNSYFSEG